MPYKTVKDIPKGVQSALPARGQKIWMAAFNSASKQYPDEDAWFRVAWSAVKNVYRKDGDKWVLKEGLSVVDRIDLFLS